MRPPTCVMGRAFCSDRRPLDEHRTGVMTPAATAAFRHCARLRLHAVEMPVVLDAFELVGTPVVEGETRSGD